MCSLPISIGGQILAVDPRKGSRIIIIITIEPVFVRSSTVSSCYKENHNDYFDIGDDKNDDIRQQIISAKKGFFFGTKLT